MAFSEIMDSYENRRAKPLINLHFLCNKFLVCLVSALATMLQDRSDSKMSNRARAVRILSNGIVETFTIGFFSFQ